MVIRDSHGIMLQVAARLICVPIDANGMMRDDSGVAGFFEDLPVLAFVLGGIFLLISSSVWCHQITSERDAEARLQADADEYLDKFLATFTDGITPIGEFACKCEPLVSGLGSGFSGFLLNVSVVHPYPAIVITVLCDDKAGVCDMTAFSSGFLNAIDEARITLIVEVRLLVW